MTSIAEDAINTIAKDAPNAPIAELAEAAAKTVESPTPLVILSDLELLHSLYTQIKAKLAGTHPKLIDILKAML